MKRLICYADIETAHQQGENYLIINEETIVTPLAKDLMEEYQFEIRKESPSSDNKLDEEDLGLSFSKESLITLLRKVLTEGNTSTDYFEADTYQNLKQPMIRIKCFIKS
jgi:ethanolamine utilization cobalamin adenosyltransferase